MEVRDLQLGVHTGKRKKKIERGVARERARAREREREKERKRQPLHAAPCADVHCEFAMPPPRRTSDPVLLCECGNQLVFSHTPVEDYPLAVFLLSSFCTGPL